MAELGKRIHLLPPIFLLAIAITLRLQGLAVESLWPREAGEVLRAFRPLSELMPLLALGESPGPLYPTLLHLWIAVAGNGELAVRLPSAVAGATTMALVYVMGRRLELLARPKERVYLSLVGLVAALLVASSDYFTEQSQRVGPEAMATLLGVLSSYLLLRALGDREKAQGTRHKAQGDGETGETQGKSGEIRGNQGVLGGLRGPQGDLSDSVLSPQPSVLRTQDPGPRTQHSARSTQHSARDTWWLAYAAATSAALYTHHAALLLMPFHALYLALAGGAHHRAWARYGLCTLAAILGYLPWLAYSSFPFHRIALPRLDAEPAAAPLLNALAQLMGTASPDQSDPALPTLLGLALLIFGTLAVIVGAIAARRVRHALFLLLYLAVPTALLLAIEPRQTLFDPGYLVAASPAGCLIMAWGIAGLLRGGFGNVGAWRTPLFSKMVLAIVGILALATAVAVPGVYWELEEMDYADAGKSYPRRYGDYRAMVAYMRRHAEPGDGAVLMSDSHHAYSYYGTGSIPAYRLDRFDDVEAAVLQLNRGIDAGHRRLWFVLWQPERVDPAGHIVHLMEDQTREVPLSGSFGGIELRLFELTPGRRLTHLPRIDHQVEATFGDLLQFQGWSSATSRPAGGQETEYDLHWQLRGRPSTHLRATLLLTDGDRHVWARTDRPMATPYYPPSRWREGEVVPDRHRLVVPPGIPPGSYRAELRVYDPATGKDLQISGAAGEGAGARLSLGLVDVLPTSTEAFQAAAAPPPSMSPTGTRARALAILSRRGIDLSSLLALDPASPSAAARWDLGIDRLELLGGTVDRPYPRPGDTVEVTLRWRAAASPPSRGYLARVALLDRRGDPTVEKLLPLVPGYPATQWRSNEVVMAKLWLPLPVTLPPARYGLAAALATPWEEKEKLPPVRFAHLTSLEVQQLPRVYRLPPMQNRVGVRLGKQVELAGFDLSATTARPGDTLRLTLYWRVLDDMDRDFKVFNHVIDDRNAFGGQRDSVPVAGNRPTVTWREREVLADVYLVPIYWNAQPGAYLLKTGMYAPEGGERLPVTDASGVPAGDSITLAKIEVVP